MAHTEETKQKIRDARTGVPRSDETKSKISATLKGKPRSEETKSKISASRRAYFQRLETADFDQRLEPVAGWRTPNKPI